MTHIKATFQVDRSNGGRRQLADVKPKRPERKAQTPHITKLMALAIRLDNLLATGQISGQAEIARARVTQNLNLTNLAPNAQEAILELPHEIVPTAIRGRELRKVSSFLAWWLQRKGWNDLASKRL